MALLLALALLVAGCGADPSPTMWPTPYWPQWDDYWDYWDAGYDHGWDCSAASYPSYVSDGYCDPSNNVDPCYDGGDCCESTCVSTSSYDCGVNGYDCQDPYESDATTPLPTHVSHSTLVAYYSFDDGTAADDYGASTGQSPARRRRRATMGAARWPSTARTTPSSSRRPRRRTSSERRSHRVPLGAPRRRRLPPQRVRYRRGTGHTAVSVTARSRPAVIRRF
ncbi:hypothetical protein JL720_13248 [Aureococcus anophagefferens]|nr:hypothetical protein JL720_13248 [Aureococcus anophagefferens]